MKNFALFAILFITCLSVCSQTLMNKDSLLDLLPAAKPDTNLVNLYINIGQQYEISSDYEVAKDYYRKAGELSKKLAFRRGMIRFAANYTYILNIQEKTDSSLLLNKEALRIAEELNDLILIVKCYTNLGSSFMHMDFPDSGLVYYEKARSLLEDSNDTETLAKLNDNMQVGYRLLGQYNKAIQMGEAALEYYRTKNDEVSLGIVLSNLGTNYVSAGKTDKGRALFMESLQIARAISYPELEQGLLLNIGNLFLQDQVVDSLNKYFSEALRMSKNMDMPEGQSISYRGLALESLFKKDFVSAGLYIDSALGICDQFSLRKERASNLETLSSILYANHQISQAERTLQESTKIRDSLSGEQVNKLALITEKKFETQKKDSQIKLQQETIRYKSILNYIFAGGSLALLIIVALGYRTYSQKQKLQKQKISELETEKQLAATEAVLEGEEKERTRLAKDLHDGLGGMLSGIKYSFLTMKENLIMTPENQAAFERSMDMLDSSIKEMRRVAHNMMPEALLKFGLDTALRDFCSDINNSGILKITYQSADMAAATMDQVTSITLYRIAQELISNTIKHAGATTAIIQLTHSNGGITLTVEDNGKGFDTSILQQTKGIGWTNIQSRVDFLKGKLDIKSSAEKGTSVLIELGE